MKLTAQQQLAIRSHLLEVTVTKSAIDELYDHIVTALEQKPETKKFNINNVQEMINTEFNDLVNTPKEKKRYQLINNVTGFILFGIATLVYWLTMEPTVSFWDCGEFISAASKLEVGHQPGAPLFLLIGRFFSLFAMGDLSRIAYWVNFSAVLASGATVMFLFWTITALTAKLYRKEKLKTKTASIVVAGAIGAMAYMFSDTFWFSAVESEVYALSSLFTAITFWAILKWESKLNDRWLIFIAFLIGLSIGVHLLSLLTIPAIALVYYFRKTKKVTTAGTIKALIIGCVIEGIVQFGIIQYFVLFAAKTDLLFVNTFGLSFGAGAIFFVLLFAGLVTWGIYHSIKFKKYRLNLSLLCLVFLMFGFSSYFVILIRANAKPNINLSNPDNPFALYNYLGRNNYGSTPLLYGNTFDAKTVENEVTGNTYRKGKDKYEISGNTYKTTYDKNLLFPRTYSQKPDHANYYKRWLHLEDGQTPTMGQNLQFFATWQLGQMYWRYFMWNFAGRQNDIQGQGDLENGNWLSGIKPLDSKRLGNQSTLPGSVTTNEGHNIFYSLPFILGLAGLIWMFRKNWNIALTVTILFLCTGVAIVMFLNMDPLQVRERDYAFIGSFYTFTIFIGFGVLAIKDILSRIATNKLSLVAATVLCFAGVPLLMGMQGWDDHNRSQKTTVRDWAKNYLNSCAPNAILFTNADNDTYPLWYAQEVEGIRTDVRVICIQFLGDDAFINQMKKQSYRSAPLPISMADEKYVAGERDYMPYVDYGITDSVELKDLLAVMTSDDKNDKVEMQDGSFFNFLPTKKFKLTVNPAQLVKTKTIKPTEIGNVTLVMEWTFNKNYASKADLTMFDIIATNNWERPVYFATSVSEDTYIGLDKYLYNEGYAYRLLPFKANKDVVDKEEITNSDVMYDNVMNKLDYSAFKKATYLDPETRRVASSTWKFNNTLVSNLIAEGKTGKADQIMQKNMKELPLRNYSVGDTLNKLHTVQNLYALNHTSEANKLAKATTDFLKDELGYIITLTDNFKPAYYDNAQFGLYILSQLDKTTAHYQQKELNAVIKDTMEKLMKELGA